MDERIPRALSALGVGTGVGSGLIAGVFFAFSTFVMPALARLPAAQGIAAMQSINVTVITRSFLGVFMGTALLCIACALLSIARIADSAARFYMAAALLYLIGCFGVTAVFNVPRNDVLASLAAESAEAAAVWPAWVASWTAWNHVRCAASTLAALLCFLGGRCR